MNISQSTIAELQTALGDERCGLFFLAGFDGIGSGSGAVTVHVAEHAVGEGELRFLAQCVTAIEPSLEVHVLTHSARELYAPDSLEAFAGLFEHEHILADPTGAFARGPQLLALARKLRAEFDGSIDRILWRMSDSALLIVAAPSATRATPSGESVASQTLCDSVNALVQRSVNAELSRIVKSVRVVAAVAGSRYVPIDAASVLVAEPVKQKPAGVVARIAGAAAMLGLGTVVAAANTTGNEPVRTPGITALAGLTTLGENSMGIRNPYQAAGGLRLYFGEIAFLPSALGADPLNGRQPRKRLLDVDS